MANVFDQIHAEQSVPGGNVFDQIHAETAAPKPEEPGFWHEIYQQSGIPGLVEGIKRNPAGTIASAMGGMLSLIRPGLTPVPAGNGRISLTEPSQIENAFDIAERGPKAIAAAATLGAAQTLLPKVVPEIPGAVSRTAGAVRTVARGAIQGVKAGAGDIADAAMEGAGYGFAGGGPAGAITLAKLKAGVATSRAIVQGVRDQIRLNRWNQGVEASKTAAAAPAAASGASTEALTPEVLPPERRLGPGAIPMPGAPDASFARPVEPGRGVARDPNTGRMMRVYSSTEQPLAPTAANAAPTVQPPPTQPVPSLAPTQAPTLAPTKAAVEQKLASLPPEPAETTAPARTREQLNQQYQQRGQSRKAEAMARTLYYGGQDTPGAGISLEDAQQLLPKREDFASDPEFAAAQERAESHWLALAKAQKITDLQAKGPITQSDLPKINGVEAPSPETRRLVLQKLERYWQAHEMAQPSARPKTGSMGAMKRYRTDYNPAALTDEQIQALHQ